MSASKMATALEQLQHEVSNCEKDLLELIQMKKTPSEKSMKIKNNYPQLQQSPIAIVGMASIFPESRNQQEYWEKIIRKIDCITDVPPSRWDVESYYDPDPKAPDKTYCKRGGFIPEVDFNPMEFGLPPNILEATDISQLLSLVVAKEAMEDAGYGESRQFNRERAGVILGVALARQLTVPLAIRLQYPIWEKVLKSSGLSDEDTQKVVEKIKLAYVSWEENSFPGMLANVAAGRIANRLDLGGTNCVVDAACASSLGALSMAISELVEHRSDMMLVGGVDTDNSILAYMSFSKTPAVSKSQNVKPFDAESDGMMLGEGIGMLVLKRLEDAERDNDRIYAVIKGIGTSSDGRYKSIYAPRQEGQVRALRRAYENAGVSPLSVELIEAHGTGTMAGDPTEFGALNEFFGENNPRKQYMALGSVKSQIGHTKAAAGAASLIKTALALHHKVLPPTINVTKPNPKLNIENSPFYLNTETRPWIRAEGQGPRRAGVSAFGFGGSNYHVVLEEYESEHNKAYRLHKPPQSVLLFAPTPAELLTRCEYILRQLHSDAAQEHYAELTDLCKSLEIPVTDARVGFVANSLTEASNFLQICIDWLRNKAQAESWEHPQGIYYRKTGMAPEGKVVALFSGQGSQYLEMGRELVINFPCLRHAYGYMDNLLLKDGLKPISERVFPPPVFDTAQKNAQVAALQRTEYAQPAIGVFSAGLYKILQQAGFKPNFVAGHSFGELTALWAAEVLSDEDYFFLVKARGQAMATPEDPNFDAGAMLAVKGNVSKIEEIVKNFPQVAIANFNSNNQVVLAGAKSEIAKVQKTLHDQEYSVVPLPVSAAFHTPLVGYAQKAYAQAIEAITFKKAAIPAYTNVTGKCYPPEPQAIQQILKTHLLNSVLFKQEIENIYADGGYFFIEFGPRNILTNLVKDTLGDKPHLAVALSASRQEDSDRQLRKAVVQLRVAGLHLNNIDPYQLDLAKPKAQKNKALNVRLSSINYVSEKRKMAFEQALQDGHQIKLASKEPEPIPVSPSIMPTSMTNTIDTAQAEPAPVLTPELKIQPKSELSVMNYQRVLDSLESTLAQFNQHQSDVLHVHEQSLNHQMEYAKTFFQLMQQQSLLLGNSKSAYQNAQTTLVALESSERNMMRFHDHQAETLRIHGQYLNHQMEYATNYFQLIKQQYTQLITDDSTDDRAISTQVAAPTVSYQDSPAALPTEKEITLTKQDLPVIVTTTSAAVSANELVTTSPEPVFSNASSNGFHKDSKPFPESLAIVAANAPNLAPSQPELQVTVAPSQPELQATVAPSQPELQVTVAPSQPELQVTVAPSQPELEATVAPSQPELEATVAPSLPVTIDFAALSQTLLTVVSEKTGYPVEMLELSMDMEADLGIDSIKRVEILGALQELNPDLPKPNPEELAQQRTLGQIVDYMRTLAPQTAPAQSAPVMLVSTVEVQAPLTVTSPEPSSSNGSSNGFHKKSKSVPESLAIVAPSAPNLASAQPELEPTAAPPSSVTIDFATLSQTLLTVVSEKTGYPAEMLELSMDMEADLGIDSIKRVEILGALQELHPDLPKPNPEELAQQRTLGQIVDYMRTLAPQTVPAQPAPVTPTVEVQVPPTVTKHEPIVSNGSSKESKSVPESLTIVAPSAPNLGPSQPELEATVAREPSVTINFATLSQTLLTVVSEKTGYPVEMLELSMDMEADLGIDSIKRVEILGALQELHPNLPKANPEELAERRTLGQIVEYIEQQALDAEQTLEAAKKKPSPEFDDQLPDLNHNGLRRLVRLKALPEPDLLDFTLPENYIGLLTDDGSPIAAKLAKSLIERGWKVVVLSFPQSLIAERSVLPPGITRIVLEDMSEEHLKQQLAAIANTYGAIGAFIHLNPLFQVSQNSSLGAREEEKAILKHVFLAAKYLKKSLNEAAREGRSCFCTMTRLDGAFGLTEKVNFSPISAGLFGLTKSLNCEWEAVFCRAIDLSPAFDADQSAQYIFAELHDPNRYITEVGYSLQGRTTLISESST